MHATAKSTRTMQRKVIGRGGKSAVLQEKELIDRNTLIIEGFEGKPKGSEGGTTQKKTHRNIYEIEREYLRKSIKEHDA